MRFMWLVATFDVHGPTPRQHGPKMLQTGAESHTAAWAATEAFSDHWTGI